MKDDLNSDMAELRLVREIPDGDYNREIEIEATAEGLRIDDYIVISWKWIRQAREAIRAKVSGAPLPKEAQADSESTES